VFSGFGGSSSNLARRAAFERIANGDHVGVYESAFADVQGRALEFASMVNSALAAAPAMTTVFPNSALGTQLKTVARMIGSRDRLAMSRQIFFVAAGGFDTHDAHLLNQPKLLGDLSASLTAFYRATVELGAASNVTTFTHSDFGRTLTSNGDGSDHAWGGVQLVVGDAVRGSDVLWSLSAARARRPRGRRRRTHDPGAVDRSVRRDAGEVAWSGLATAASRCTPTWAISPRRISGSCSSA
jgi:uncharacterized protein (DUF1501 family)